MDAALVQRIREVFDYEPETGHLRWAARERIGSRVIAGAIAGCAGHPTGRVIRIDGRLYLAHRLVWLHQFGKWPIDQIDHINGNKFDNRLANLREATDALNRQNTAPLFKSNTSGHKGVSFHKQRGRWRACIAVNKKYIHLGLFDTFEEAKMVWLRAKAELHPFNARVY